MTKDEFEGLCEVAGPVSRETFLRLKQFESEFRRWSSRINLSAPSTLPALWERHVLDSAQLLRLDGDSTAWLDIGSGGGFPGAVMAILLSERTGAAVELVESNRKKAAFLQSVLGVTKAPARVFPLRIDDAVGKVRQPQVVTARALAPLGDLLELAAPWLTAGARALFHKGRDYRTEIANCNDAWRFDLVEHASVVDPSGAILEISGLQRR